MGGKFTQLTKHRKESIKSAGEDINLVASQTPSDQFLPTENDRVAND